MYEELSNGRYSVKLKEGHFVFNKVKGNPFVVTDDFHDRMKRNDLGTEDRALLSETSYLDVESENTHYAKRIKYYIDKYQGPVVLDLAISESCNLGCHMCIHAFSVKSGKPRIAKRAMKAEVAKAWIDYYVDHWAPKRCPELLSFHFGAAEPFLTRKTLLECLDYIRNKRTKIQKEILINTNLTMLDEELLQVLVKNNVHVSVGLDGLKEQNDLIRVDSKGRGTFDVIIKNVQRLVSAGIVPGINITLTDRNYEKVDPKSFLGFMNSLSISAVLVDIDFVLGINVDADLIVKKLLEFQREADEIGIKLRGNWKAPFYNLTSEDEEIEPKSFCASIRGKNIVVTPSRNLSFCTYSSNAISESSSEDARTAMESFVMRMKEFMASDYLQCNDSKCAKCPLLGFCGGGCHITAEQQGAQTLMCEIYKRATHQLIRYEFDSELIQ